MQTEIVVYDLTVSKIWCTMCANKIKSSFEGLKGRTIYHYYYRNSICVSKCDGRESDYIV